MGDLAELEPYGPSSRAWVVAPGRRQDEELDTAGRADVAGTREQSAGIANLEFIVNGSDKLPGIANGGMDHIYSTIVSQQVAARSAVRSYLTEVARPPTSARAAPA